jgi:hypothetical protein
MVYSGDITNSYSTGDISGTGNFIGGIAGGVSSGSSITNSYAAGNISGNGYVGGIAGETDSDITNSAAINPSVSASSGNVNRIVGSIYGSPTTRNNFALGSMTVNSAIYNGATNEQNGTSKTMPELKTQSTYSSQVDGGGLGWLFGNDASNPWKINANKNGGLPYLYWENR